MNKTIAGVSLATMHALVSLHDEYRREFALLGDLIAWTQNIDNAPDNLGVSLSWAWGRAMPGYEQVRARAEELVAADLRAYLRGLVETQRQKTETAYRRYLAGLSQTEHT